jgi:hypothetical protein
MSIFAPGIRQSLNGQDYLRHLLQGIYHLLSFNILSIP